MTRPVEVARGSGTGSAVAGRGWRIGCGAGCGFEAGSGRGQQNRRDDQGRGDAGAGSTVTALQREFDPEPGASAGPVGDEDAAAVGGDMLGDERQAEAGAVGGRRGRWRSRPRTNRSKMACRSCGGTPGPSSSTSTIPSPPACCEADGDRAAAVACGVVEQVGQDLVEPAPVDVQATPVPQSAMTMSGGRCPAEADPPGEVGDVDRGRSRVAGRRGRVRAGR